jgi:hypothetical protein
MERSQLFKFYLGGGSQGKRKHSQEPEGQKTISLHNYFMPKE